MPYYFLTNPFVLEGYLTSCSVNYLSRELTARIAYIILISLGFFVPYLLILILYILIVRELNPYTNKEKYTLEFQKSFRGKQLRRDVAATKAGLFIIISFLVSWLPYAVVCTYAQFGVNIQQFIQPHSTTIAAIFAKSFSILNPGLYTLTNKQCKKYFSEKFTKKLNYSLSRNERNLNSNSSILRRATIEHTRKESLLMKNLVGTSLETALPRI